MKKLFFTLGFLALGFSFIFAQEAKPVKFKNDYYNARIAAHAIEGLQQNAIIFFGNSITEQGWWKFLLKRKDVENRGIGGDNTFGMLDRLPDILKSKPRKIFFMGGINDLGAGRSIDTIAYNVTQMIRMTKKAVPSCQFYVQSVLPLNESRLAYPYLKGKNPRTHQLNERLKIVCQKEGAIYVDIAKLMTDEKGELKLPLTKDGIHIHPEAYQMWVQYLKKNKYLK